MSGATLQDALRAATAAPAALLGRAGVCARIAEGEPANLLRSRPGADSLAVVQTWLGGEEVYRENRGN
jgi:N-acetylglucosamine-6-phosphate deacetylase